MGKFYRAGMGSGILVWTRRAAAVAAVAALAGGIAAVRQSPVLLRLVARVPTGVLFAVRTTAPRVALTFDDGPHPELTPALVEVLERHGAGATFFLLGSRALQEPGLVAELVRRGHEVGNHLWNDRASVLLPT